MNAKDFRDINDVSCVSLDLDERIAHAQRKRALYSWNDWGRRMTYTDLTQSGAAQVDHWPDPAFNQDGNPQLWLRAEVWRHHDGTFFRALLAPVREGVHQNGAVVVEPLECCHRPNAAQPQEAASPCLPTPPAAANVDRWIDDALMAAYEERFELSDD